MNTAIIKLNGGAPVILCSICRTIVKEMRDFSPEEVKFAKGEGKLDPLYCDKHQPKVIKK